MDKPGKPEKPKTDNLGWILALIFPKKSKPAVKDPAWMPKPAPKTPPAPTPANPVETNLSNPASTGTPFHPVTAPSKETLPPRPATPPALKPKPAAKPRFQLFPRPGASTPPASSAGRLVQLKPRKPLLNLKTLPNAFWTVTSTLSLIVNVILIVILVVVARELFTLKAIVGDYLLGGLYENFVYMDQAHIKTNITVAETIPINFTLPISQDTVVVLTENTPINGANVRINSGGVVINSAANIVLPAGTNLPVHLELNVPVTTTVPIKINVPVDIPLEQTELHKPFIGLQQVVSPFYWLLDPDLKNAGQVPACQPFSGLCDWFFYKRQP